MNKQVMVRLLFIVLPLQSLYATSVTRQATITGGRGVGGKCPIGVEVDGAAQVQISDDTGVLTTLSGQVSSPTA
jgi:hypothetical protein